MTSGKEPGPKAARSSPYQLLAVALLLLIPILLAFGQSLFAYFTCDDLWHLPRFYQALATAEPLMLLDSFWKPWADRTTAYLFYRPVTELALVSDFLLYRGKAFGYHLSNIIFHWINSILVFYLASALFSIFIQSSPDKKQHEKQNKVSLNWQFMAPYFVSLLFAIHPLNTEPVSWVLCRADLVGAMFYLLTLIAVLVSFRNNSPGAFKLSYLFLVGGLLSKESCATLPLVLMPLIFLLEHGNSINPNNKVIFATTIKKVRFHWMILIAYLGLRAFVLDSISGGYVGSIGYVLSESILERLFIPVSLWKIFHPFNIEVFESDSNFLEIALRLNYGLIAILLVVNTKLSRSIERRSGFFILSMLFLSLLFSVNTPVWSITDGMAGSRIAYFLTVPVALGIVLLLVPAPTKNFSKENILYFAGLFCLALLASIYISISRVNTGAWLQASDEIRGVKSEIERQCRKLSPGQSLMIFNLPDHIKGTIAFFSSDYVKGLLQPPLTSKDISSRVVSLDGCPLKSPLLNKDLVRATIKKNSSRLCIWSQPDKKLIPVFLADPVQTETRELKVVSLGHFGKPKKEYGKYKVFENSVPGNEITSFELKANFSGKVFEEQLLCLEIASDKETKKVKAGSLCWHADQEKEEIHPIFFQLLKKQGQKTYKLPLSSHKDWLKSRTHSKNTTLRLDLPPKNFYLKRAYLEPLPLSQPRLTPAGDYSMDTNGTILLKDRTLSLDYDLLQVRQAKRLILEVSHPNTQFAIYNRTLLDMERSKAENLLKTIEIDSLKGKHKLNLDFARSFINGDYAYFQVRIAGVDENGLVCGAYSMPLDIRVDKQ